MGDYRGGDTGEIYSRTMCIRAGLAGIGSPKADLGRAFGRLQIVADSAGAAARLEDKSTLRSGMGL